LTLSTGKKNKTKKPKKTTNATHLHGTELKKMVLQGKKTQKNSPDKRRKRAQNEKRIGL